MAGIQASNGIVTGIDIQGTVDQLMSLAATPRNRLTNATAQIQNEQVALTSLTALIIGVQLSTDRLAQPSLYSTTTATSSSATKIKSTVTNSASPALSSKTLVQSLPGGSGLVNQDSTLQFNLHSGESVKFSTELDSETATLGALIDEINSAGKGKLKVSISSNGRSLEFKDLTRGSFNFTISSPGGTLAKDLGIQQSVKGAVIGTKSLISTTSGPQPGTHSFIPVRQASAQQLTSSLLTSKDQLVGAGEFVIQQGGFLDDSVLLDELNGGAGVARGSIRITDRSGSSKTVDLRFAQTVNDVVDAINKADGIQVVASVDGDRFKITDTSSGAGTLSVGEVAGGTTASDLGLSAISTSDSSATGTSIQSLSNRTPLGALLDKRGLVFPSSGAALKFDLRNGDSVELTIKLNPNNSSLGDLISAINTAGDGQLAASISADGKSLEFQDLTTGSENFTISSPSGSLASALGVAQSTTEATLRSTPLIAGLNDVLLASLNGGEGLGTLGQITLTDRANVSATVDLSDAKTLGDVINTINQAGNGVRAQLNRNRTGIEIVGTTGSTSNQLSVTNFDDATETATKLQIAATVSKDSIDSGSLSKQWINENTQLKDWNQGKGITFGSIRLTDSNGQESAVNLVQLAPKTVGDVIDAINKLTIGVEAKINETGDGILIVDTAGGSSQLKIVDVGNSTTAKQLGIAGTSREVSVNGQTVQGLDGSRTIRIATTDTTTVSELAENINALETTVSANLLSFGNTGARLILNGTETGSAGRVAVGSDLNLGFSETVAAKDALLAYGANESSGGILVSSSDNNFTDVIEGVRLEVLETSTTAVTVTVARNSDGLAKQLNTVVAQFNRVRDKINTDANYDEATKSAGILFGSGSVLRIELAYGRLFTGQISGSSSINSITQLGVRLNDQGKLEFDESKLNDALANNPEAVQEFFSNERTGFAAKAKEIADSLAGTENGSIISRTQSLQAKIDQNNARIANFTLKLDKQRTRLLTQFYNLEESISKIRNNLNAINSINTNLFATNAS